MEKVSVVIPTFDRNDNWNEVFLRRAIYSIFRQTYQNIEILVIIDGKSEKVKSIINKITKEKKTYEIRVIETGLKVGGSEARNEGIKNSTGYWIALLDDDDEWLPNKIQEQINQLMNSKNPLNTVCFTSVRIPLEDKELPRLNWNNNNDLCEYLFCTRYGRTQGMIQTSTILASRKLFMKSMFTKDLPQLQDWDWIIKTIYEFKCEIIQITDVQSYYHSDGPKKDRVSGRPRGDFFIEWLDQRQEYFNFKSYGAFYLTVVCPGFINRDIGKLTNIRKQVNMYLKIPKKRMLNVENLMILSKNIINIIKV